MDLAVELSKFSPGQQPAQPSPEELEEDIAGNDKLAPMLEKLKDLENFVSKLSGGAFVWPAAFSAPCAVLPGARHAATAV